MLTAVGYPDGDNIQQLLDGLNVVGPVKESHVWPYEVDERKHVAELSVDDLLGHWAWEYRALVETMDYDDKSDVIYKDTMEEVTLGFCEGAWDSPSGTPRGLTAEEVSAHLGTDDWLPLKRFGVVQKNKVRGCDDAAANGVNGTSSRSEKVTLSSVDRIVALVRLWSQLAPGIRLGSWACLLYTSPSPRD